MNNLSINRRIEIFDGFRGYGCVWVALIHMARLLDLHDKYWIPDSQYALGMFFILSGYVIANLIENNKQSYGVFLFRRYCRLAPVFTLFCIVYILHANFIVSSLMKLDVTQHPVFAVIPMYTSGAEFWYLHLPAHIFMLHGLFDQWLHGSSMAILPPGWTMTVEWQFYLFAPLLLLLIRKNYLYQLGLFLLLSLIFTFKQPIAGTFFTSYIWDFLAGIFTCLYIHSNTERLNNNLSSAFLLVLVFIFLFTQKIELSLWVGFLLLAYGSVGEKTKRVFYFIFNNKVSNYLGKISYSFYLCHMLAIFYTIPVVVRFISPISQPELFYLAAVPMILALTILVSTMTYHLVENPMILWSKKVSKKWRQPV